MNSLSALAWGAMAATFWGLSAPSCGVALRHGLRVWPVLLWFFGFSLLTAVGAALAFQPAISFSTLGTLESLAMGVLYLIGDFFYFSAIDAGRVTTVVPIVACNGAISALLAVLTGASLTVLASGGLALMVVGLLALTTAPSSAGGNETDNRARLRPLILASGSALSFGIAFFMAGRITGVGIVWVVVLSRAACVLTVACRCILRDRLVVLPRRAVYWAGIAGALDAAGYLAFVRGSHFNLPIAAIVTSQWSGLAVLVGVILLHERLTRRQVAGVVLLVAGTAVLASP